MIFKIKRTSHQFYVHDGKPPCEDAIWCDMWIPYIRVKPQDRNQRFIWEIEAKTWSQRPDDGFVRARRIENDALLAEKHVGYWQIEIADLNALLALKERLEEALILCDDDGMQAIEIYDDYRE